MVALVADSGTAGLGASPSPPAASSASFLSSASLQPSSFRIAARFIFAFMPPPPPPNRFKATNREPVVSLVDSTASGTPLLFIIEPGAESGNEEAAPPPPFCAIRFIRFIEEPRLNLKRKGAANDDGNSC